MYIRIFDVEDCVFWDALLDIFSSHRRLTWEEFIISGSENKVYAPAGGESFSIMAMIAKGICNLGINPGDILFTRMGRPVLVTGRDATSAEVSLQGDLKEVQEAAPFGIKNGLNRKQRDEFEANRFAALSEDKRQEILQLRYRIRDLREKNSDPKVIHYLENELQHLVIREGIVPNDYMVNERTLVKG